MRLLSIKFAFGIKKHTNPLSNSISFDLYGLVCVRLYEIFALSSRTPLKERFFPFASSFLFSVCGFGCLFSGLLPLVSKVYHISETLSRLFSGQKRISAE